MAMLGPGAWFVLVAAFCGCGADVSEIQPLREGVVLPELSEAELAEPLDPRRIAMGASQHLGTERVCDLGFVGRVSPVSRRELRRYAEPVSHRVTVRCRAESGSGWADLVYAKDSASLAPFLRVDTRIRVRVVAEEGFDGYPVVAFVADLGAAPPAAPARWEFTPVAAGDDISRITERGECALMHIGPITPARRTDLPENASHRTVVSCRHALGEEMAELAFLEGAAPAALALHRGDRVPVMLHRANGRLAELPILVYGGP
ncbi:MAG: hypothetical protein AAGE52_20685 [Myxococcota bacterium]